MGYLGNLYKIFRGTTPDDGTGTPARDAANGLNSNMDAIDNALQTIDNAAEKKANKAVNLDAPNDTNYPSTKAVSDAIGGIEANANTYTDTQLNSYQATSEKGQASGYAPLDANGKVPTANTYAAVDEIVEGEYINATTFNDTTGTAVTPGTAKIYQDITTGNPTSGKQYRWGGSQFVEIIASPGTTDEVVEGTSNLYFTAARVRATLLDGIDTVVGGVIAAGDSVLSALGKLQAQVTSNKNTLGTKLDKGTYTGTASDLEALAMGDPEIHTTPVDTIWNTGDPVKFAVPDVSKVTNVSIDGKEYREGLEWQRLSATNEVEILVAINDGDWVKVESSATAASIKEVISFALSSPSADLAAGDTDSFHAPYNFTLRGYFAGVVEAPTGSALVVGLKKNNTSVTSSDAIIDADETTSLTGTAPVLTETSFLKGDLITPSIVQVGSLTTGKSLKIYLEITKS